MDSASGVDPVVPQFRFGPEPVHLSGWGWLLGIEQIVEHTWWYRAFAKENAAEVYQSLGPATFHGE